MGMIDELFGNDLLNKAAKRKMDEQKAEEDANIKRIKELTGR